MPSTPTRSARLKTLAALRSGARSNDRHVHQFKIACLEFERTRCTRERHAAMNRIKLLERRLAELDATIGKHQEVLAVPDPLREGPALGVVTGTASEPPYPLREEPAFGSGPGPGPGIEAAGEKWRTLRY